VRILVTGGAGYIGSIAVAMLLEKGYRVTVLDDLSTGHLESLKGELEFVEGSILNRVAVEKALRNVDAVIHFAGKSIVSESVMKPDLYYRENVLGTEILLKEMVKCKVRKIVFSSSASVYGEVSSVPIKEDERTEPVNPYGKTKLEVEKLIELYVAKEEFAGISLRYFNVAGAYNSANGWVGELHAFETHLIPNMLNSTKEKPFEIFGTDWDTPDKTCIRDYVHVEDLIKAHIRALEKLNMGVYKVYNLGSGRGYSVKEIYDTGTIATSGKISAITRGRRAGDPKILVADISSAILDLDWYPEKGISEMVSDAFLALRN